MKNITDARWQSTVWLSEALQTNKIIGTDVRVTTVTSQILTGGLMANTLLLKLTYQDGNGSEPTTIVGKFPSPNIDSRTAGKEMQAYEREVNFYNHLADKLTMRVPRCYFAEIDVESGNFSLLIEALNPAIIATSDSQNCLALAKLSMEQLALLQRDTWNDENIQAIPWVLDYSDSQYFSRVKSWAKQGWAMLKNVDDERLSIKHQQWGDEFINKIDRWSELVHQRSACLSHCDYRFANKLYRENEAITVDWQTLHWSNPGADIAYFLLNSLTTEQRQLWQNELRSCYFNALLAAGIVDYSLEKSNFDFCMGVLYDLLMIAVTTFGVGASGLSDTAKEQLITASVSCFIALEEFDALKILA